MINCPKDNEATNDVFVNGTQYICCTKCKRYFKLVITEYNAHTGEAAEEIGMEP